MTTYRPTAALLRAFSRASSGASFSSSASPSAAAAAFPAKQVTRRNFDAALSELRRHVRSADFVAIDLEMTGVTSAPWRECFEFDGSDVRYLKVKDSAEKFAVVQVGVVPFRWDSNSLSFVAYPHNFYVFPRQELTTVDRASYEFLCQTGSIDFLAKYKFDFNACIREGISYLSRRQESEAIERLNSSCEEESHNLKEESVKDIPLLSIADTLFAERMKKRFSEWRDWLLTPQSREVQFHGNLNDSKQQFNTQFFKMRPAISLNGFTSTQLRFIQSIIRKDFKDLYYVHASGENAASEQLVVYTESKDDKDLLMKEMKEERRKQAEMKIKAAIGFRHVIDLLSSEQKLIVGHNCFLDTAHIYNKFIGPLPSTAEEFVSLINQYFPHIIDTKILLNTHPLLQQRMKKPKTSLSSAFSTLCPHISMGFEREALPLDRRVNVEIEVDETRSATWNSGVKHEAGYDAFMTGCIFAQICGHAGVDFKLRSQSESLASHEKLRNHINLLYLSWTNADIINLRTGQKVPDPPESRNKYSNLPVENVLLIWGSSSSLKARDVKQRISKVLGPSSVRSIYQLDESAVFVRFARTELVSQFLCLKAKLEKSRDTISVLNPIAEIFPLGGDTRVARYETYKEICGSVLSKVLFADQAESLGDVLKLDESVELKDLSVTEIETVSDSFEDVDLTCDKILDSFYSQGTQLRIRN